MATPLRMLNLVLILYAVSVSVFNSDVVRVLRAMRGYDARLPCGTSELLVDGPGAYVLWLKDDHNVIQRFPIEDADKRTANQKSVHDDFSLHLKNVVEGGIYRCRVFYESSAAVDYVIDLQLVDAPGTPTIFTETGELMDKSIIGPYKLGDNFTLICEVHDDHPNTTVHWKRNGVEIQRAHAVTPGLHRAEVHINNASRAESEALYECISQNAEVTQPLTASVVVKMAMPPLRVQINLDNNTRFESGEPRIVDCIVEGSFPHPLVRWRLGKKILRSTMHSEYHEGHYSISSLTLSPALSDNGKQLKCEISNAFLPNVTYEDKVNVSVGARPVCISSPDQMIGIVQGQIESTTCLVEASPEPTQYKWTFPNYTLYSDTQKIKGSPNQYQSTLVWQPSKDDIGTLECRAVNSYGEQKQPCTKVIVQGGPPHSPKCQAKSSPKVIQVQCEKGWDGGRPQMLHVDLLNKDGALIKKASDVTGSFNINIAKEEYNPTLARSYSCSVRGCSPKTRLRINTADYPGSGRSWVKIIISLFIIVSIFAIVFGCIKWLNLEDKEDDKDSEDNVDEEIVGMDQPNDGSFRRAPDCCREERPIFSTCTPISQLPMYSNQCSSPKCRVAGTQSQLKNENCCGNTHTYYV